MNIAESQLEAYINSGLNYSGVVHSSAERQRGLAEVVRLDENESTLAHRPADG